ncbi:MAG: ATP-binding cassette domain-containing protein [Rubripirellula sp.]
MTHSMLIQIDDLTRRTTQRNDVSRVLLDDVSLEIDEGQRIGLVGRSGSGKSCLMRAIAMLDRCESGEVRFRGERIVGDRVPSYRRQVVYLPQRPAFVLSSVRQNLEAPFRLSIAETELDETRILGWLSDLGRSPDLLEQSVEQLSGGEQQVIALLRALSVSPTVILFDEPTASLDAVTGKQFENLVEGWIREDLSRSILWTSHDEDQIQRMTSQTLRMNDGRLLGATDE